MLNHTQIRDKWIISEVEDGGGGIVPYEYKENNFVNALQWAIGSWAFLLIKDPWRVFNNRSS